MENTLIAITIVTFAALLFFNIYFRIRSFRTFKKLADKNIYFTRQHVFDSQRLEQDILRKHPENRDLILSHVKSMKTSMLISTMCVVVLTLCGAILMYYRK